jgi:hypothetical protein
MWFVLNYNRSTVETTNHHREATRGFSAEQRFDDREIVE